MFVCWLDALEAQIEIKETRDKRGNLLHVNIVVAQLIGFLSWLVVLLGAMIVWSITDGSI